MSILNSARSIKKYQSMKSENLSLKSLINKLDFRSKTVVAGN